MSQFDNCLQNARANAGPSLHYLMRIAAAA